MQPSYSLIITTVSTSSTCWSRSLVHTRHFGLALGIIGLYIMLVTSVSWFWRKKNRAETVAQASLSHLLAYIFVTLHGLMAGTDAVLLCGDVQCQQYWRVVFNLLPNSDSNQQNMTSILLIDDDPFITGPLARALRDYNYQVTVADNGRTGLEVALRDKPDVVVLDVMMPQLDGWEVCRALREQSGVPILMLTALGEEVDRILGLELGADDYLTKPFSTRELIVRIKAMVRRVELDRIANQETILEGGDHAQCR